MTARASLGILVLLLASCMQPAPPTRRIEIIKSRLWRNLKAEELFSAILKMEVAQGHIILNQSKEDGIINTDWTEYMHASGGNRAKMRIRASYVVNPVEAAIQLRINLKLERKDPAGWEAVLEDDAPEMYAQWYQDNFTEISRQVGRPYETQRPQ